MNDSLHLLAGAYALDALDAGERGDFEEHLAGCQDCTAEVRELLATAARLGALETVLPPASMRAAVLAEIRNTAQEPGATPVVDGTASDGVVAAPVAAPVADGVVVPLRARRMQRLLAVAAAVLAVVAIGLSALLVQARSDRAALADRQQQLTSVLTASDARTVTADVTGGGRAAVVISQSRHEVAFVGAHLATPAGGHVYQLWYITSTGKATSAGVFSPGTQGNAAVLLEGDPSGAATVGLTVEPDGGSAQPTTKPVLAVPISA